MNPRVAKELIALAIVSHCYMLWNLISHFEWISFCPPSWEPVITGAFPPAHWQKKAVDKSTVPEKDSWFEKKLDEMKELEICSKGLIKVPNRQTDNLGLDFLLRDSTRTDPGGDFFQIYHSGFDVRWRLSIYENYPKEMDADFRNLLREIAPFHPPNRYPPPFAYTAGVALSYLQPWDAYLAWIALHELALIYCIFLTWRVTGAGNKAVAAAMWLMFLPWYLELYMGQTTFIVMTGACALGSYFHRRRGAFVAGLLWTLTLIAKPISLLFAPILFRMKQYRMLAAGIGITLAGSMAYFAANPEDGKLFVSWAFGQEIVASLGNYCFQNLQYHLFFSDRAVLIFSISIVAFGLLLTFAIKTFDPVRLLSIWICIYFLGYAHVWQHHLVLLLPAIILPYVLTGRRRFLLPWLAAALPSGFYLFEGHWTWLKETVYLSGGSLPVILLFGFLMFYPKQRLQSR
jgi:hypothetical protein